MAIAKISIHFIPKAKRNSFAELDNRIVNDNRKFWKTVKHTFSEKAYQKESIAIIKKNTVETITKHKELAEICLILFAALL